MQNRRSVVVFSAAPLPVGTEVEVQKVRLDDGVRGIRLRDVGTSVLYGGGGLFDAMALHERFGAASDYRSAQLPDLATVEETFRARVLECVVANVAQSEGYATCTSFVVELLPAGQSAYR